MSAANRPGGAHAEQQAMMMLADSGRCIDFWDIEVQLRSQGYSADDARRAMADATTRRTLNDRCHKARMHASRVRLPASRG
jgi:hypothetical protein